ncbi:SGNH/GDSL hydrolase family protein [Sinomonas flava]|uniref:SGNH/GDSL hydrolase family protein n=1 Tax=Sinomonas flava TaxID=496857 RepID=UPI0039A5CE54
MGPGRLRVATAALAVALASSGAPVSAVAAPASVAPGPSAAGVPFATPPLVLAPRTTSARRLTPPALLPLGSLYADPATGRRERILGDLARTAVLIGDSQSEPTDSWVRRGLEKAGYSVYFAGKGGTGFSVGTAAVHDYDDALRLGDWLLPHGDPGLVVVQGGGNDATRRSSDAAITKGAVAIMDELRTAYPHSKQLMVGTLSKSAADGGGRRTEVDALLGRIAARLEVPFVGCGDWISRYGLADELADGVHLKASGMARLTPIFADSLAAQGLALD